MRVSELVERSGVPLATVKYYIREGLLPAGHVTSTTRASYGEAHLQRLRLIKALTGVAGLPLGRVRDVLDAVDHPDGDLSVTLGRAVRALSDTPPSSDTTPRKVGGSHNEVTVGGESPQGDDTRRAGPADADTKPGAAPSDTLRAQAALRHIGQRFDPGYSAVAQLEEALTAAEEAGMPVSEARLAVYGAHIRAIAEAEMEALPADAGLAVEHAVLGTILFEPVISALRRVAHQDLARQQHARV